VQNGGYEYNLVLAVAALALAAIGPGALSLVTCCTSFVKVCSGAPARLEPGRRSVRGTPSAPPRCLCSASRALYSSVTGPPRAASDEAGGKPPDGR